MRARRVPRDDDRCGWLQSAPAAAPPTPLTAELRCDAVVVGAGFTGLAAATRLSELRPGWRVVLLEAQTAGFGASGRSSGFVVDLAHFIARMAPADAERYIRLARAGIASIRERVRAFAIDCDWDERGWFHVAATPQAVEAVGRFSRWLEERGERFEHCDERALERSLGIRFYRAGLRLPGSILVHTGKLVRGLAHALPPGVELFEQTPVLRLHRTGKQYELECRSGRVSAPRVLVAANGYSAALGVLRRRVVPLFTFGSWTRPLTDAEAARLGGEREWGALSEDPMGSTIRRTRDGRILVRNTVAYGGSLQPRARDWERAAANHRRAFEARFPMLGGVELETTWSGLMGVTPSRSPFLGEIEKGVFAAAAYSGAGIATGMQLGALLAELAVGETSSLLADALALPGPTRLPPQPFRQWGTRVQVARMNASAPADL